MSYTLGFLGFGKMAQAIWKGLEDSKFLSAESVCFVEKDTDTIASIQKNFGITAVDIDTLFKQADTIILAIKPQSYNAVFPSPITEAKTTLIISILAGTPLSTLSKTFPNMSRCRVMPNTPALVGECMSGVSFCDACTPAQAEWVMALFSRLGKAISLPESDLDLVTGVSGSGPAFFYQLAIYVRDYAASEGIPTADALTLVAQTMVGAGKMLLECNQSPESLIQAVSSPNGTTVKGLETMNNSGIESDFIQVIKATKNRSEELRLDA